MSVAYPRETIYSVDDIRAIADRSGILFFSPDTMRFFQSRVLEGVRPLDGASTMPGRRYLFITSERHGDAPRHYALRIATLGTVRDDRPHVDISTVGGYHQNAAQARRAMAEYVA